MHFTISVIGGIMSGLRNSDLLLTPSKIADTDSDEVRVSSNVSSVEGGSESMSGVSQPQLYHQTASCHGSNSSIWSSASDKEDARESGSGE